MDRRGYSAATAGSQGLPAVSGHWGDWTRGPLDFRLGAPTALLQPALLTLSGTHPLEKIRFPVWHVEAPSGSVRVGASPRAIACVA